MRFTMRPTLRVVSRAWPPLAMPRNCIFTKRAGVRAGVSSLAAAKTAARSDKYARSAAAAASPSGT